MASIGKVVALISRWGSSGPEICVFEHPLAGIQLPAGTLRPGEDVIEGALREAFEETGLDELDATGEMAQVPASEPGTAVIDRDLNIDGTEIPAGILVPVLDVGATHSVVEVDDVEVTVANEVLSFDAVRHIVHMGLHGATPDEWWVITPDGGWLAWRCFWLPVEQVDRLGTWQQAWFHAAQSRFDGVVHPFARAGAAPEPASDLSLEFFFAPPLSGDRVRISWLDEQHAPHDDEIGRCEVVAFTDEGRLVAIAEADPRMLGLPGGHRERGETLEDTLRRELREEACAELLESELLGFQRLEGLKGPAAGTVAHDAMFWARVRCDEFEPRFETRTRRLLTVDEARALPLWSHPLAHRQIDSALAVERRMREGA